MSFFGATIAFFLFIGMCSADPSTVPAVTSAGPLLVPVQQLLPKPYEFVFEDGLGMNQYRREVADGTGAVRVVPVQPLIPKPYEFGFEFGDGLGMSQRRQEVADGTGVVRGSYGYLDPLGVNRVVEYTADADGYKAVIRSNEPGTASHSSANAVYFVQPPPAAAVAQGLQASQPKIAI